MASVRPKACNQVTGRYKGGGLESPPTNKLHTSPPEERKFSQKNHGTRGTCDSRGVGGVDVVNTSMAKKIDSFEQLTTRIGRLLMRRCGPTPALTIFVAYAPKSHYGEEEEEVEAFSMDLEKFYRDHACLKMMTGLLDTFTTARRGEAIKEDLKEKRTEAMAEAAGKSIRYARRNFASRKTRMTALRNPKGTTIASRKWMKKIIYDFYSDLFDSRTSKTLLLYKKGDPHDIGNYRPVCLLSVIYKLFTRVILNRIEKSWMKDSHASKQGITRVQDAALSHLHRLEQSLDSVETETVMEAIDKEGPYSVHEGTLENARRKLEWDDMEVKVDGRQLYHLRFADDVVLITPNISEAERMLVEF
ncbi:hypothetical protein RB195_019081 [Necator americanus]|uniref:Reverse transcriptase domain-containing protein n=1 Tax=Necator americanus TaxID=51031 RepID=A0ABR1CET6_NECAM